MLTALQIVLTAIAGALGTLCELRAAGRLTRLGKVFGVVIVAAATIALLDDYQRREEARDAPYVFDLSRLTIAIEATYWLPPLMPDSLVLANTPSEFAVLEASIGDYPLQFEVIGIREVWRPSKTRAAGPRYVHYSAQRLRPNDQYPRPSPYKHIWDLDGDTLSFHVPLGLFRQVTERQEWTIRATAVVGTRPFRAYADERGYVTIGLSGLTRDSVRH